MAIPNGLPGIAGTACSGAAGGRAPNPAKPTVGGAAATGDNNGTAAGGIGPPC